VRRCDHDKERDSDGCSGVDLVFKRAWTPAFIQCDEAKRHVFVRRCVVPYSMRHQRIWVQRAQEGVPFQGEESHYRALAIQRVAQSRESRGALKRLSRDDYSTPTRNPAQQEEGAESSRANEHESFSPCAHLGNHSQAIIESGVQAFSMARCQSVGRSESSSITERCVQCALSVDKFEQ
jgi:hypothetical protein